MYVCIDSTTSRLNGPTGGTFYLFEFDTFDFEFDTFDFEIERVSESVT